MTTGSCSPGLKVPRRAFRSHNDKLPATLSIIGLGCSSFSTFFWTPQEQTTQQGAMITAKTITKDHPRVQEWIQTIHYAVLECGITLLDTAPWYGHGTSEIVIGFAMDDDKLFQTRHDLTINTKVGRYEADPLHQFDFSYKTTLESIQRSIQRMKCQYIDVLQLHDPEFAPTMEQLMEETIPAMIYAQSQGWCKALGMTGYPLEVQYQILQRSLEVFGTTKLWDQALTYGHFNLHNTRLTSQPIGSYQSFADYCVIHSLGLLAAAPLSMGLLTPPNSQGKLNIPDWHPACLELQQACQDASIYCQNHGVNIATLATLFALSQQQITCTIIGCSTVAQVQHAVQVANRFHSTNDMEPSNTTTITFHESQVLKHLLDREKGPFATVWKKDLHHWDGIHAVHEFWKAVPSIVVQDWQDKS